MQDIKYGDIPVSPAVITQSEPVTPETYQNTEGADYFDTSGVQYIDTGH